MAHDRIPYPPSGITGELGRYLNTVAARLNSEAWISKFSGTSPNLSQITGGPGNFTVNVGSASTDSRLWVMGGNASRSTNSWVAFRTLA